MTTTLPGYIVCIYDSNKISRSTMQNYSLSILYMWYNHRVLNWRIFGEDWRKKVCVLLARSLRVLHLKVHACSSPNRAKKSSNPRNALEFKTIFKFMQIFLRHFRHEELMLQDGRHRNLEQDIFQVKFSFQELEVLQLNKLQCIIWWALRGRRWPRHVCKGGTQRPHHGLSPLEKTKKKVGNSTATVQDIKEFLILVSKGRNFFKIWNRRKINVLVR